MNRIYLSPPHLDGREGELLLESFFSNWITTLGPHVDAFEKEMCQKTGARYAAALSSGTAALHLSLILLGVKRGDEVLCSTLTFSATANAIAYCGAHPVFVDSDEPSWEMNPVLLEEEIEACRSRGRLPKAVIVVDLYGQCADYDRICAVCSRYQIPVIEDAAEALGATYGSRQAGTLGTMGILSFNGNKIITTSGGGMLLSDNPSHVLRAKHLATQAREPVPYYEHTKIGYNYRLSNLLAAVGRGQLENLDKKVEAKRKINALYRDALHDLPGIKFMPEAPYGRSNCWLTCITVDPDEFGATNDEIRLALEAENIESRPTWKPMHRQPVFAGCRVVGGHVADEIFRNGLCLPSGTALAETDLDRIVQTLRKVSVAV